LCKHELVADADAMNLGLLLFIPYRYLENAVLSRLREHGHDLPVNQARVFQRISPEGSRMSELAEAAQVTKQTLTSIVDQLERAGYVRREVDPADARARIVRIAPRGQEAVELAASVVAEVEAEWQRHLGKARTRQLRGLLALLCEVTDPFAS
jgi:DNA-binding MarR family transcriptional regulator